MLKLENHSVTQEPIMLLGMTEAIVTDNQYCVFATRAYIVYITFLSTPINIVIIMYFDLICWPRTW